MRWDRVYINFTFYEWIKEDPFNIENNFPLFAQQQNLSNKKILLHEEENVLIFNVCVKALKTLHTRIRDANGAFFHYNVSPTKSNVSFYKFNTTTLLNSSADMHSLEPLRTTNTSALSVSHLKYHLPCFKKMKAQEVEWKITKAICQHVSQPTWNDILYSCILHIPQTNSYYLTGCS